MSTQVLHAAPVTPQLWIGAAPPQGATLKATGFDTVVLCAQNWQPPDHFYPDGVEILRFPFHDTYAPDTADLYAITQAVDATTARIRQGKRVLVTCKAGINRSGLVCALVYRELHTPNGPVALQAVRRANPHALRNMAFEDIVLRGQAT